MSISKNLMSHFPAIQVRGKTIQCSEEGDVLEALSVIDYLVRSMRGERISPYFNSNDTKRYMVGSMQSCDEPVGNLGFLDEQSWASTANRVDANMFEDRDLMIPVFMLTKGVYFKVNNSLEGKCLCLGTNLRHEEIDLNLIDSGNGWTIRMSFNLDD